MSELHALPQGYKPKIFLYGPPGSGKSKLGRILAEALDLPFWDLDEEIQLKSGLSIPEIFQKEGESGFRAWEARVLEGLVDPREAVIALGGGALLDSDVRRRTESWGKVIVLDASLLTLVKRLQSSSIERPLLGRDVAATLGTLLEKRASHYASFESHLNAEIPPDEAAWEAQIRLGRYRVRGMGAAYDVFVIPGGLDFLGELMRQYSFGERVGLVCDEHVAALYAGKVDTTLCEGGFSPVLLSIPPGEEHKTIDTVQLLWRGMLAANLERGSGVLALGGGVVGDLAGFTAATYLRGIAWAAAPTSLLAMVDASLGGKTGVDMPEGKNLVGAFHAPRMVLADPHALQTLPQAEMRSGMAEVVKHAVIGDPRLFSICERPEEIGMSISWDELVRRAMAVKIKIIQEDPYESGSRATLNFGHTIGHAVEAESRYQLRHGEAVAIGMVLAARLAERMGVAEPGLCEQITRVLAGLGLPTSVPDGLRPQDIIARMRVDKKNSGGKFRFVLPARVGEVVAGVSIPAEKIPWQTR